MCDEVEGQAGAGRHQAERALTDWSPAPCQKRPSTSTWGDSSCDPQAVWVPLLPPQGAGERLAADMESSEVTQVGSGWALPSPTELKGGLRPIGAPRVP